MARRALIVWVALLVVAIVNGAFREAVLIPRFGGQTGHQLSTLMLSVLILLLTLVTIHWLGAVTTGEALTIGTGWVLLTLAFEFLAGHYAFGTPWADLLADYNILAGRIWILVLATTAAAPWIALAVRGPSTR